MHRPAAHVCGASQTGAIGNVLPGALNVMQRVSSCMRRSFFTSGTRCDAARRTTTGVVGVPPGPRVAACDVSAVDRHLRLRAGRAGEQDLLRQRRRVRGADRERLVGGDLAVDGRHDVHGLDEAAEVVRLDADDELRLVRGRLAALAPRAGREEERAARQARGRTRRDGRTCSGASRMTL